MSADEAITYNMSYSIVNKITIVEKNNNKIIIEITMIKKTTVEIAFEESITQTARFHKNLIVIRTFGQTFVVIILS